MLDFMDSDIQETDREIRILANKGFSTFGIDLLIRTQTHVAEPLIFKPHEKYVAVINPTCTLTMDSAQMLMDELWNCGVRPSNGEGSVGQIGAIKSHLEDMRTIAFSKIGVDKDASV